MIEKGALGSMGSLRSWLLWVAALAVILVGWQLTAWGVGEGERIALSLFPGGTPVPLSEIRANGPVADVSRPLLVSRSMAAIEDQAWRTNAFCRLPPSNPPPRGWAAGCWRDLEPASGRLLIATVRPYCVDYARFGILHSTTLEIRVIDRCPGPPPGAGTQALPTYTLLGVPLERLPRSRLTIRFEDDRAQPATVSVSLS
jgi:hypothetical protein